MGEHPNHTEIRLTEVRASVEILVDPALAPGSWMNAFMHE